MSGIYNQYKAQGLEVLLAAINQDPQVPQFIRTFNLPFAVGTTDEVRARNFLQISAVTRAFVPWLVIIDRKGMIREQQYGDSPFFQNQQQNIRSMVEKLLSERAPGTGKKK
ncbi:MAG: hypothetical protein HY235_02580 [Acidobacteria bacterium]|nr:hypothetical protein [Acidobacteriota bacterium]